MKKKQSKLLIIVILVAAGLLGVAAIVTAVIYSQIEDETPQQTIAETRELNKCDEAYVMVMTGEDYEKIAPSDLIREGEAIKLGAIFRSPKADGNLESTAAVQYISFTFEVNSDTENSVTVSATDVEVTKLSHDENFNYFTAEIEWDDWESLEGKETLTVTVIPRGTPLQIDGDEPTDPEILNNVGSCPVNLYVIDRGAQPFACLEAGETGTLLPTPEEPEVPCPLDDEGNPIDCEPEESPVELIECCSGLVQVENCSKPSDEGQCSEAIEDCESFICLENIEDEICDEDKGENGCNSPIDCADLIVPEDEDPVDPAEEDPDPEPEPDPDPDPDDPDPVDPDPVDPDESPVDTSNFTVSKSGPTCVERVSPSNQALFKITVTNGNDAYEDILQIKDKLPLGFTYVAGSSKINGTDDATDQNVQLTTTGESQEVVWSVTDGWSVGAGEAFEIEFTATAGDNALTGDNINEVVVTPRNNPVNEATLRTEYTYKVEQSCSTPETGILDNIAVKLGVGFVTIIIAAYFYFSNTGVRIAESVHSSTPYEATTKASSGFGSSIKMIYYKWTQPREHFERKVDKKDKKRS